jgi:hypothetical protein
VVKERLVKFPSNVAESNRDAWLSETILKVFNDSQGILSKFTEYPGIFDRDDIESEFLIGVHDGLCRVDWNKGNPMIYLMQSGIWRLRTYRYRALRKRAVATCIGCGRVLSWNEEPCHTPEGLDRVVITVKDKDFHDTMRGANMKTPEAREHCIALRDRLVYMAEMATDQIERHADGGTYDEDVL